MKDHLTRALYEYVQMAMHSPKPTVFPSSKHSGVESFNTKIYVTLRDERGAPLVMYRVRLNGYLRRVFRWPPNMNQPPKEDGVLFKRLKAVPARKIL